MLRLIKYFFLMLALSAYIFPLTFTFLPSNINTKMMLAVLGSLMAAYTWLTSGYIKVSPTAFIGFVLASLFSLACYISVDYNGTDDFSYASYIVTFFVWLGGAYACCTLIKAVHGTVDIRLITYYLAAVCVMQCTMAIVIDRVPAVQLVVDKYTDQAQDFMKDMGRLYGLGAALDSAGVRFAVALILMAGVLSTEPQIKKSTLNTTLLLTAFLVTAVIGNIISRTTSVGLALALVYLALRTSIFKLVINQEFFRLYGMFILLIAAAVALSVYFYNTDKAFEEQVRFAFEGFFNYVEKGEFRTSSTDKLNKVMWIWPKDTKTWIIGSGIFGSFVYDTDIGYCRFILYCGLVGFSIFCIFFIYNGLALASQHKAYYGMFLLLIALGFIIWLKVATDIFFIYALFYCIKPGQRQAAALNPGAYNTPLAA